QPRSTAVKAVLGASACGIAPGKKPMTLVLCWARAQIGGREHLADHARTMRCLTQFLWPNLPLCKARLPPLASNLSIFFQLAGYILSRTAFSSIVSGKNSSTGDEKAFGRQGAGRRTLGLSGRCCSSNQLHARSRAR